MRGYDVGMAERRPPQWTREEREREQRVREIRAQRDSDMTPEERLRDTLRISRFMSELRQGVPPPRLNPIGSSSPRDVRAV
jgi:hypothetical protein